MVRFKSIPQMYNKELSGRKPNTVREIDEMDDRFKRLYDGEANVITIENTETGKWFLRAIKDVSVFNNLMIISWEHDDSLIEQEASSKK